MVHRPTTSSSSSSSPRISVACVWASPRGSSYRPGNLRRGYLVGCLRFRSGVVGQHTYTVAVKAAAISFPPRSFLCLYCRHCHGCSFCSILFLRFLCLLLLSRRYPTDVETVGTSLSLVKGSQVWELTVVANVHSSPKVPLAVLLG